MEGRMKKYRQLSPEQPRVRPQKLQGRKAPVVYYLCRNRHLEHPHFIEVPFSSPEGLYLRDVINRLNVLRGKGMASMYSWSCKRNYKNGFVWHDLGKDDLILPVHGSEYVLKGSELLEGSPPDCFHDKTNKQILRPLPEPTSSRSPENSSSSSSIIERPTGSPSQYQLSSLLSRSNSSDISPDFRTDKDKDIMCASTLMLTEYKVPKHDIVADASTQTDDGDSRVASGYDTCSRGVPIDETSSEVDCSDSHTKRVQRKQNSGTSHNDISPPPSTSSASSSAKAETLESLVKADGNKINSFRILEEEEVRVPPHSKLRASKLLMQLVSCGSISVKDHHGFRIIPTYSPTFTDRDFASPMFSNSMILMELDCFSDSSRFVGTRLGEKEYFSGSLLEARKQYKDEEAGSSVLQRSSSYNADRTMIMGLAMNGRGLEAIHVYEDMRIRAVIPNDITFVGVLCACCHMGLVDHGRDYFNCMNRDSSIAPKLQHYACLVDIFGRAGHLDEACQFITDMPIVPGIVVWGALLGASRIHKKYEMGKLAA